MQCGSFFIKIHVKATEHEQILFKIFLKFNEKHYFNDISTCSMKLFSNFLRISVFMYVCF